MNETSDAERTRGPGPSAALGQESIKQRFGRAAVLGALLGALVLMPLAGRSVRGLSSDTSSAGAAAEWPSIIPASPMWPADALVDRLRDLLLQTYGQQAVPNTTLMLFAPRYESEKRAAPKDPDTLWEYHRLPNTETACHGRTTFEEIVTCTGYRLARSLGRSDYSGWDSGPDLFDPGRNYYANEASARVALHFGLYHAFVHDFDVALPGEEPTTDRDDASYHMRVVRAYEAHARDIIVKSFMLRDPVDFARPGDPEDIATLLQRQRAALFQVGLTRTSGHLASLYVPLVHFIEERGGWDPARPDDRKNALAIMNALGQRTFWEWLWSQQEGPVTAGFADLGAQHDYETAISDAAYVSLVGTDAFDYRFEGDGADTRIASIRSKDHDDPAPDFGGVDGFWFDSDYAAPGDWWCYANHAAGSSSQARCLDQSRRASQGGEYSPFGQYYGDPSASSPCSSRRETNGGVDCGETTLGSISEEWLWTYTGMRAALYVMSQLHAGGDPELPNGALGHQLVAIGGGSPRSVFDHATERLGYGVSGFHGGPGHSDDLEWPWAPDGVERAVRTLSAARHDGEPQDGRLSEGEGAVSDRSSAIVGDTWDRDRQEYPGAIENHAPGPSPLYGTFLFGLVLSDQAGGQPSSSLYDMTHRDTADEFNSWLWLAQSSYFRCTGVDDPADDRCFARDSESWPSPPTIQRQPLFEAPDPEADDPRFDYLWPDSSGALDGASIAPARDPDQGGCGGPTGSPWRAIYDFENPNDAGSGGWLHDDGGYGAYDEMVQGLGGLMRLLAARHAVEPDSVQRTEVQKAWYDWAFAQVDAILYLYAERYGYLPEAENATCADLDPDPAPGADTPMMLSWQQGAQASSEGTAARRAMRYSFAATWYWWYDAGWLDIDGGTWSTP